MAAKIVKARKQILGRPRHFESREALQAKIDEYWNHIDNSSEVPCIAGISYFLGIDRQTFYNYEEKDDLFDIIKYARDRILMTLEQYLIKEGKAGQIFLAKNYGYYDKQEIVSISKNINIEITPQINE